ncbi:MAG: radical SAM protein [Acidobacteria bacterium]|nr:radical SAM protein [Acidobacteriota bacterium]
MSSQKIGSREEKKAKLKIIGDQLGQYTQEGELYEKLSDSKVFCYSCGHRCRIADGLAGVCKVRFNQGGKLYVPWGYVAGLQCDPIEKKPFFHAMPGTDALSFGMLGCDLHCDYCFTGETIIVTNQGVKTFQEIFSTAEKVSKMPNVEIAYPTNLQAISQSGKLQQVRGVFKHPYKDELVKITPYYLPELSCTFDHRVYATTSLNEPPRLIKAGELTLRHYLTIPRNYEFSSQEIINVGEILGKHQITYKVSWDLSMEEREAIIMTKLNGETSGQIGGRLGKDPSYIRQVRSKINRGMGENTRTACFMVESEKIRFPNEHKPGIPITLPLDINLAKLLGYYCAEGSITTNKDRPNSYTVNFSFSHKETELANEVIKLLETCFGVKGQLVKRTTTLAVAVGKASLGLLFKALMGEQAEFKCVPKPILNAPKQIIEVFLNAYIEGGGHKYSNGKASVTTISKEFAYGVAWLVLKLGYLPSISCKTFEKAHIIEGRLVNRATQYTIVWYETKVVRKLIETEFYYLVPIKAISLQEFEGDVYNMEVEEEHNYLAGFFLVSNCQNWITSQVLRDPNAIAPARKISSEQMLEIAEKENASTITSTYNEPLITSEWAISIFKKAKEKGFLTSYVSNGNGTPEVLDYLRPWVDLYKVDLKSFRDKHYRELGGLLSNVLETIKGLKARGFWLEIVTLVIPDFNDSLEELKEMAEFLVSVDPFIPWHLTAFHSDYKMMDRDNTNIATLLKAAEMGREVGLKYVYIGNAAGRVGGWENTWCHNCGELLIERYAYHIKQVNLKAGCCPKCKTEIPGRWSSPRFKLDYQIDKNHGHIHRFGF